MINYKNLYAGAMVLNEFKDKLKSLSGEYTQKLNEACPENIAGLWDECCQSVRFIKILFVAEDDHHVTLDELVYEGFVYKRRNDFGDLYEKQINGINVTCCIKSTPIAEDNASNIGRVMKDLYAGAMVLNEFKEKLKVLCDEYTRKRAEACPENYASDLWDEKDQTVECVRIQFSAKENGVTIDELVSEGFVCRSTDTGDYYEKMIGGVEVVCSVDREVTADNERLTKEEKAKEVNSIIAGLREKYSLEDIKSILVAARLKATDLIRCAEYLPEETSEAIIDESDLPF